LYGSLLLEEEEEEDDDDDVLGTRKRAEKVSEECFGAYSSFCSLFSWHVVEVGSWKKKKKKKKKNLSFVRSLSVSFFFLSPSVKD
jgi:hypothetical protein